MNPVATYFLGLFTPVLLLAVLGIVAISSLLIHKAWKWFEPLTMLTTWGDRRFARKMRGLMTPGHAYESRQLLEYLRSKEPWRHLPHLVRFYRIMHRAQPPAMTKALERNAAQYDPEEEALDAVSRFRPMHRSSGLDPDLKN